MTKNLRCTFSAAALAGIACLVSGCQSVTQAQLDEVRTAADVAKMTADEALRTANTADYQAAQAKAMADEALTKMRRMKMKDPMMRKRRMMKDMMK